MKLGYVIIYVADVKAAAKFYDEAFGLATRFIHESGDYAELNTGETTLAFANHALGESNFPLGYAKLTEMPTPPGIELAFISDNVEHDVANALSAGATLVSEPELKPWGQTVAYVRAPDGALIEVCSPIGG